jgi:hypothetical protein
MVWSSSTLAKPGASPRGLTSVPRPGRVEPMTANGECARKLRQCASSRSSCLSTASSIGGLYSPRNPASSLTTSTTAAGTDVRSSISLSTVEEA